MTTSTDQVIQALTDRVAAGEPLRVGIVGLGASPSSWAETAHLPALRNVPGVELRGVSASSPDSARVAAERHGIPHAFASAAEMADSDEIDVIVVCVRVPLHAPVIRDVLGKGKLVFSEWPLGATTAEARQLVAEAAASGTPTKVGLQARFNPAVSHAAELVAQGYVGEVLSSTLIGSGGYWGAQTIPGDEYLIAEAAGATMRSIAVGHALDAIASVLGEPTALRVEHAVRRDRVRDVVTGDTVEQTAADQVWFSGRLPNGAVLTGHYRGGQQRGTNLLWEILGSEGELRLTHHATGHLQVQPVQVWGARGEESELTMLPVPDAHVRVNGIDRIAQPQAFIVAHEYRALLDDLGDGGNRVASWEDAVRRHASLDVAN